MTMKMTKFGVAIIGLLMSTTLWAGAFDDATAPLTGAVNTTDCGILASQAKVNLSTGVVAALHCRSIWGDAIVGACHSKGNVAPTNVDCTCSNVGTSATPNYKMNVSTCPGSCDSTGGYVQSVVGEVDSVLLAGRKAYGSTTAGGQLSEYGLGDTGLCNDANLAGIDTLFP